MDVSIIIVNYNTCAMTLDCIKSVIEKTENIEYEIILVDNASIDQSREVFSKLAHINYIYSEVNLGFGLGNNLGYNVAKGRNIFFLNSDTLLKNNAVSILSNYLDNNHAVGICGGNLFDYEDKPTISFERRRPSILRQTNILFDGFLFKLLYGKNAYFNYSSNILEVGYISGADFMVRKELLDKYGGFSSDFFMYYEETELANRINNAGYKIVSIPNAEIIHLQGMSLKNNGHQDFSELKLRYMYESYYMYLKKCLTPLSIKLIHFIDMLNYKKNIIKGMLKNDKVKIDIEKVKMNLYKEICLK